MLNLKRRIFNPEISELPAYTAMGSADLNNEGRPASLPASSPGYTLEGKSLPRKLQLALQTCSVLENVDKIIHILRVTFWGTVGNYWSLLVKVYYPVLPKLGSSNTFLTTANTFSGLIGFTR